MFVIISPYCEGILVIYILLSDYNKNFSSVHAYCNIFVHNQSQAQEKNNCNWPTASVKFSRFIMNGVWLQIE